MSNAGKFLNQMEVGYDNPTLQDDTAPSSKPTNGLTKIDLTLDNGKSANNGHTVANHKGNLNNDYNLPSYNSVMAEKQPPEYDPYQHRECKNPTTYWDTMFHLLKASIGTGILAMPNAFRNAGYGVGIIGTLVIGFLCTYNIHIIISSEYELCKRRKVPNMSYPVTVETAFEEGPQRLRWFAPYGRVIVNTFLVMYQIGSSSIYLVFIASNIKDVYDYYNSSDVSIRLIMLYLLVPLILICWIRNLKLLVPFSTAGNAVTAVCFIIIFWYVFNGVPSLKTRSPIGPIRAMPLFFGTVLFAMEAIGVIMPLKNEMKKPEKFGSAFGVLNFSMIPISMLYMLIGFFGYLKYGENTNGSITINLPPEQMLAQSVKLLYSASIYITYALSCYVAYDIVWINGIEGKIKSKSYKIHLEYLTRTAIVIVTFIMAVAIPKLELFISLTGALCLSTMGVAFPAIIQLLTYWNYYTDKLGFSLFIIKNIILIIIAILAFVIGVSTSIIDILTSE